MPLHFSHDNKPFSVTLPKSSKGKIKIVITKPSGDIVDEYLDSPMERGKVYWFDFKYQLSGKFFLRIFELDDTLLHEEFFMMY